MADEEKSTPMAMDEDKKEEETEAKEDKAGKKDEDDEEAKADEKKGTSKPKVGRPKGSSNNDGAATTGEVRQTARGRTSKAVEKFVVDVAEKKEFVVHEVKRPYDDFAINLSCVGWQGKGKKLDDISNGTALRQLLPICDSD
jgi:hypothetical protein